MKYDEFIKAHVDHSAQKYADGLLQSGIKPNPTLIKALAERAHREAHTAYKQRYPLRSRLGNVRLMISVLSTIVFGEETIIAFFRDHHLILGLCCAPCTLFLLIFTIIAWRKNA